MNVVCYQSSKIGTVKISSSFDITNLSATIRFQMSIDLHLSRVMNRAERQNSSKSKTLKSNKTVKVCQSAKKLAQ